MPVEDLEESVIDMIATNWQRSLGTKRPITNEELGDIDDRFLERYTPEDRILVKRILKIIQES